MIDPGAPDGARLSSADVIPLGVRRGAVVMYNVHMKKYTVGMVRERLSEALDEAQSGEQVFIQRRGVRYRLSVEPARRGKKTTKPRIEIVDPAVADGQWTWDWANGQLRFRARRR
jgi:antitoxin (DNA-binding transcriptional repressor) of toxin-antitoxin stability system